MIFGAKCRLLKAKRASEQTMARERNFRVQKIAAIKILAMLKLMILSVFVDGERVFTSSQNRLFRFLLSSFYRVFFVFSVPRQFFIR